MGFIPQITITEADEEFMILQNIVGTREIPMEKVPEISRFFERVETSKAGLSQRPKSIKEEKEDKMEQRKTLA